MGAKGSGKPKVSPKFLSHRIAKMTKLFFELDEQDEQRIAWLKAHPEVKQTVLDLNPIVDFVNDTPPELLQLGAVAQFKCPSGYVEFEAVGRNGGVYLLNVDTSYLFGEGNEQVKPEKWEDHMPIFQELDLVIKDVEEYLKTCESMLRMELSSIRKRHEESKMEVRGHLMEGTTTHIINWVRKEEHAETLAVVATA